MLGAAESSKAQLSARLVLAPCDTPDQQRGWLNHPPLSRLHLVAAVDLVQRLVHGAEQAAGRVEAHQDVAGVQVRVDQVVHQHHLTGTKGRDVQW